jgi:hypothetical protein
MHFSHFSYSIHVVAMNKETTDEERKEGRIEADRKEKL